MRLFLLALAGWMFAVFLIVANFQAAVEYNALQKRVRVQAAYGEVLNECQNRLTQRGNEIAQCVDDNEEMANRLAQGIRCPRRLDNALPRTGNF